MEECYRGIVGKEPETGVDKKTLIWEIFKAIRENPKSVNKNFVCLFLVDFFRSGWPDYCSIVESEFYLSEAIFVLKDYASSNGCENAGEMSVTKILAWIIANLPVE